MAGNGIMAKLAGKLKRTAATAGGNYIPAGRHKLKVQMAQIKDDREENPMFVADFLVLETTVNLPNCQPGSVVNYIIKSANEAYASNVKGLLLALYDTSEAEFNALPDEEVEDLLDQAFGEQQATVGRVVIADAVDAVSKKKQTSYTRIRWFVDGPLTLEDAEAATGVCTSEKIFG